MFSIASIATMSACIFLFGLFFSIVVNFNYIVKKAEEGVAITVFFNEETTQAAKDKIGDQLRKAEGVLEVNYVSAETAWETFKDDYFKESVDLADGFKSDNPLGNSDNYEVYMADVSKQKDVVEFAKSLQGVRKVNKSDIVAKTLTSVNKLVGYVSVTIIAILLAVWQLLCSAPGASLPPPSQVFEESYDLIVSPFFHNGSQDIGLGLRVLVSLERVAYGFGLAAIAGIILGAVIGQSVWAMRGLDPIFQVLRTVPPLAWLPLSLAAFQDSNPSAIFVIFITSIWPVIINTAVGVRNIPQDYRNVAQVLRLNQLEFFFKIMLPSAAPYIFTGLRIGIGLSWLAIVAAEMLTGGVGIGFFIWDAWNSSRLPDIIVALAYIGVVGFMLDKLVAALGNVITRGAAAN